MFSLLFTLQLTQLILFAGAAPTCPQGSFVDLLNGGCYMISKGVLDFWSAEEACIKLNGHLASINGAAQNAVFSDALTKWNFTGNVWIGLTGVLSADAKWEWVDHSPVPYTNWQGGAQPKPAYPFDCAQLDETNGFWSAMNCSARLPYICSVPKIDQQLTTSTQTPTSRKDCAGGWSPFKDHCYKVFPSTVAQDEWWAISTCQQYNTELASIHSAEENDFILGLVTASKICNSFIGLERRQISGDYFWRDYTTVDYTNWTQIFPMDYYNCALCDPKRPWPQCPPQSYCYATNSVDIGPYFCCPIWSTYGAAWRPATPFYNYVPPVPANWPEAMRVAASWPAAAVGLPVKARKQQEKEVDGEETEKKDGIASSINGWMERQRV